jgi:endo-1,4-beta-xylanase
VDFGEKNKMFIVGHTLVWHWQTPNWVFVDDANNPLTRDALLARMKDHIFTVVGHYKGKVNGWDVVNEALDDNGQLRKTKWLEIIGEDFIAKAFEYAHEADPNAELYYNDFSLENPAKRDGCIGLSALGVKVMITEMCIDVLPKAFYETGADIKLRAELREELNPYANGLPDNMQRKLADRYAELFSIFHKHADKISRVTLWGVYDKTSWLNNWPVRGRTNYPLLFDRNYKPKPAFFAVVKTAKGKK